MTQENVDSPQDNKNLANADDLDQMLGEPSADDLDRMLEANSDTADVPVTDASSDDLDMMLSSDDDALGSIDDLQISDEEPLASKAPRKVKQWFAKILGQELGPFDFDALSTMAHEGELSKTDVVRDRDSKDWTAAGTIIGLFDGVKDEVIQAKPSVQGNVSPQRAVMPLKSTKKKSATVAAKREDEPEAIWYCQIDGKQVGPMPFETLQEIGEAGNLNPNDKVRFEGSGGWVAADSIGGLTLRSPAPLPVTTTPPQPAEPTPAPISRPTPPPPMAVSSPPAPTSTPIPPPRPAYTPPKPRAFTPPTPSKSSGSSMGNPFENMSFDPKIFGAIGVVALLVAAYFFMPNLVGSGAGKYLEVTEELAKKLVAAGENAPALKAELAQQIEGIKAELEVKASSKRPALRALLDCYRYYFPKIFDGTPEERQAAFKGIDERIAAAKNYK